MRRNLALDRLDADWRRDIATAVSTVAPALTRTHEPSLFKLPKHPSLLPAALATCALGCVETEPAPSRFDALYENAGDAVGLSTVDTEVDTACAEPQPGATPMRRLSNYEYRNTLADLLGDEATVLELTAELPSEPISLGFRNSASALTTSPLLADQYVGIAIELAPLVFESSHLACDRDSIDADCAHDFIVDFGLKTFRRPLSNNEVEQRVELFEALDEDVGAEEAIETLAASFLASSQFLFRVELGAPNGEDRPSAYELASRLSYLIWQSMPDQVLFDAAAADELNTADQVETQVRRMMGHERSYRLYEFFRQWLDIDELEEFRRDGDAYRNIPSDLVELFEAENRAFVYDLLARNGTFGELMSGGYTFANARLAEHYGLDEIPSGSDFVRVDTPGRAGVMTQATLVAHDRPSRSSIVKRGLKIRTDVLCQIVPAPPDNVDLTLGPLNGELTQRERLEAHRSSPACAACHSLMDPLGALFDGFDATGRPRTEDEGGGEILTADTVRGTRDLDGDYADGLEFAKALAESRQARECFVTQAFRFFYGRELEADDACTAQRLLAGFSKNDYRISDLLVALTQTDQFLYRGVIGAEEEEP